MLESQRGLTDWITLDDVSRTYPPLPLLNYEEPKYSGTVLAIGRAVYESAPQEATDSWGRFTYALARGYAPGNVWLLQTYERMSYPYAVYWPLACAFHQEREQKRRFDWYLWLDDDVIFDKSDLDMLLNEAQRRNLPFIAAVPYDRMPPHSPAVVEKVGPQSKKWVKAPEKGCYPVEMTGFNLCLFRRDVFELVPEPWFGICAPSKNFSGIAPDWWWCIQMKKAGLTPWVCCDTNVTHLGFKCRVNRATSEQYLGNMGLPNMPNQGNPVPHVSPNTGALVTDPPVYPDGRGGQTSE